MKKKSGNKTKKEIELEKRRKRIEKARMKRKFTNIWAMLTRKRKVHVVENAEEIIWLWKMGNRKGHMKVEAGDFVEFFTAKKRTLGHIYFLEPLGGGKVQILTAEQSQTSSRIYQGEYSRTGKKHYVCKRISLSPGNPMYGPAKTALEQNKEGKQGVKLAV